MPIFQAHNGKLKKLNAIVLDKEKSLQQLVEANLKEVLDLAFLATEYTTTFGGRIDTLAVDTSGAPVIIEYKRNKNDNVINQSLSYLKWLKSQKPEFFEKLMIDKLGADAAKLIKLDWHNPRVICIAESYNKFDIDTAEVVPLRIELIRYRYYENNIFSLEPINIDESVSKFISPKVETNNSDDLTEYTVDSLKSKGSPEMQELFELIRERILAIDEQIIEKATSLYIAYKLSNNFAEIYVMKSQIKIHLRPIDYIDPENFVEKISEGYNWTMDRRIYLKSKDQLDYVTGLVEQSYKNVL